MWGGRDAAAWLTHCGEKITGRNGSKEVPESHSEASRCGWTTDPHPGEEEERKVPHPEGFPVPQSILKTALGGSCYEDPFTDEKAKVQSG